MKLKKTWLRTPVGEEQAAQAVLDPSIGINNKIYLQYIANNYIWLHTCRFFSFQ